MSFLLFILVFMHVPRDSFKICSKEAREIMNWSFGLKVKKKKKKKKKYKA